MISRINNPYVLNAQESLCIAGIANNWANRSGCIVSIKNAINLRLDIEQNEKCCYCGLEYGETGRGEIDHIAPKGLTKYPQFTFTIKNLAKACQLCNSSSLKHTYDPVTYVDPVYENCNFSIVHPHLDNPHDHFNWNYGPLRIVISVKNNSLKGAESIRLFELDSEKRTRARAKQKNQERLERIYDIPSAIKQRILKAIKSY